MATLIAILVYFIAHRRYDPAFYVGVFAIFVLDLITVLITIELSR